MTETMHSEHGMHLIKMKVTDCGGEAIAHTYREPGRPNIFRVLTTGHDGERTDIRLSKKDALEWLLAMVEIVEEMESNEVGE